MVLGTAARPRYPRRQADEGVGAYADHGQRRAKQRLAAGVGVEERVAACDDGEGLALAQQHLVRVGVRVRVRVRVRVLHWPSSTTATAEVSPSARRELMLSRKLQTTERPSQAARESVSSYRESSAW